MKKLYNEFFHIPKNEKIKEKVIAMRLYMLVAIMCFCLATMSATTYAYFVCNISYKSQIIKSANFDADVSIQTIDSEGNIAIVDVSNYENSRSALLEANENYIITITPSINSTIKNGFIVIKSTNCSEVYHTQPLGDDVSSENGNTGVISFKLIPTNDTTVTFLSHWGTSSYYGYPNENNDLYIMNGEEVHLNINPINELDNEILPTATPMPTVEPTSTPAPTIEPTTEPNVTPTPTPTITPTVAPTEVPTTMPTPTVAPAEAPEMTPEPTLTPAPTSEPTATPESVVEPTTAPIQATELSVINEASTRQIEGLESGVEVTNVPDSEVTQ